MTAHLTTSTNASLTNLIKHGWKPWGLSLPAMTVIWLGAVGAGLAFLWLHETTPAETSPPLMHWPADSVMRHSADRPTLVMFAHPHCPCTRATLGELSLIMAHCPNRADVRVLFFKPSGFAGWEKTDLWSSAEAIPGVTVVRDEDGAEAKRFNATTSGDSMLYDANGRLLFGGGITGSRGHSGDNPGRSAIESLLLNGLIDQRKQQTFVFGCPLQNKCEAPPTEYR